MFFRMYQPSNGHIRDILCISYCKSFQLFTRIWNKVGWARTLSVCGESCRTVWGIKTKFSKSAGKYSKKEVWFAGKHTLKAFRQTLFQCLHQLLRGAESHTQFLILSKHKLYHKAKHKSLTLHYVPLSVFLILFEILQLTVLDLTYVPRQHIVKESAGPNRSDLLKRRKKESKPWVQSVAHIDAKFISLRLMPRALVCFHLGSKTNSDIMVQRWGIYVFCTALWDLRNWCEGWLIAVQLINDSTHARKIWPAIRFVQNIHSRAL